MAKKKDTETKKKARVCGRCGNKGIVFEQVLPGDYRHITCPSCGGLSKFWSNGNSGRCFIATAAYGSPYATEVDIFRQFRDETLLSSKLGSLLVETYYFVSPPIASLISKFKWLRSIVRYLLLEPMLYLLKTRSK